MRPNEWGTRRVQQIHAYKSTQFCCHIGPSSVLHALNRERTRLCISTQWYLFLTYVIFLKVVFPVIKCHLIKQSIARMHSFFLYWNFPTFFPVVCSQKLHIVTKIKTIHFLEVTSWTVTQMIAFGDLFSEQANKGLRMFEFKCFILYWNDLF